MGSDPIALPALEWIWREAGAQAAVVGVFTQPDRPTGRGQKLTPNGIKLWALEHGLPVHQPEKLTPAAREDLAALKPDAVLVMAYGHILRQDWLDLPPCGVWNLHASILPALRGASPIQGAIVSGARESGVSLMRMVLRLDAGPVLDIERVPIAPDDTAAALEDKLACACVPLLARNLAATLEPQPPVREQDEAAVTFTRRLRKEDGRLDFAAPAGVLARRVNGLFPWPGTFFDLDGEVIKVGLAAADEGAPVPPGSAAPGTVLAGGGDALAVATGRGVLRLLRLQRPGGRMLAAAEFLRGRAIPAGVQLASAPMPDLIARTPFRG
ncbi:MAG: methionyl-tRNA formyltransferase [Opitutaceae bacterium]|nr:methionyl-tRNA formyltransferase [Opitutaceae bacterium]